jgi:6-phosphofructokinase
MKPKPISRNQTELLKVFFCYNFNDSNLVASFFFNLKKYIKKTSGRKLDIYCYDYATHNKPWVKETGDFIEVCDYFLLFVGAKAGDSQICEIEHFLKHKKADTKIIRIELHDKSKVVISFPDKIEKGLSKIQMGPVLLPRFDKLSVYEAVKSLATQYMRVDELQFGIDDDLPVFNTFSYEKDIIKHFIEKKYFDEILLQRDLAPKEEIDHVKIVQNIRKGCPINWPEIESMDSDNGKKRRKNPLDESIVGKYRPDDAKIYSAALTSYHQKFDHFKTGFDLTFCEAGPREELLYPRYLESKHEKGAFRVAVLVSGGIAPGINAVIDGITQRHFMYYEKHLKDNPSDRNLKGLEIWGLKNGFLSFNDFANSFVFLINNDETRPPQDRPYLITSKHANAAGSILGTSREETLLNEASRQENLERIIRDLYDHHIRILYIIGGDGSMRAAHAIYHIAQSWKDAGWDLSVVGIPKTMDNDILWTWQTFGFSSAVEKSRMIIEDLAVEVSSNPRLGIIQLFGSDSGYVVSHSVLASSTGVCDLALIPEVEFSIYRISQEIKTKYSRKGYGLIVLAETAIPSDALQFIDFRPDLIHKDYFYALDTAVQVELSKYYALSTIYFFSDIKSDKDLLKLYKLLIDTRYRNCLFQNYFSKESYDELKRIKDIDRIIRNFQPVEVFCLRRKLENEEEESLRDYFKTLKDTFIFCNLYAHKQGSMRVQNICKTIPKYILEKNFYKNSSYYVFKGSYLEFLKNSTEFNKHGIYHYIDVDLSTQEKLAVIEYYEAFLDNRRIEGQTNDNLRSAGLKMVTNGIKLIDPKWGRKIRSLTSEPRHLLRSMAPGTIDIINGSRLGTLAVDNAMAGYTDFMISQWLTEFCMVPLKLVILGRKRIPKEGIFWKSVIAKTDQPENLVIYE